MEKNVCKKFLIVCGFRSGNDLHSKIKCLKANNIFERHPQAIKSTENCSKSLYKNLLGYGQLKTDVLSTSKLPLYTLIHFMLGSF